MTGQRHEREEAHERCVPIEQARPRSCLELGEQGHAGQAVSIERHTADEVPERAPNTTASSTDASEITVSLNPRQSGWS